MNRVADAGQCGPHQVADFGGFGLAVRKFHDEALDGESRAVMTIRPRQEKQQHGGSENGEDACPAAVKLGGVAESFQTRILPMRIARSDREAGHGAPATIGPHDGFAAANP